jgi:hypothetical protein
VRDTRRNPGRNEPRLAHLVRTSRDPFALLPPAPFLPAFFLQFTAALAAAGSRRPWPWRSASARGVIYRRHSHPHCCRNCRRRRCRHRRGPGCTRSLVSTWGGQTASAGRMNCTPGTRTGGGRGWRARTLDSRRHRPRRPGCRGGGGSSARPSLRCRCGVGEGR